MRVRNWYCIPQGFSLTRAGGPGTCSVSPGIPSALHCGGRVLPPLKGALSEGGAARASQLCLQRSPAGSPVCSS